VDVGAFDLKGIAAPVRIFEVTRDPSGPRA
jgi:hypothetical protein